MKTAKLMKSVWLLSMATVFVTNAIAGDDKRKESSPGSSWSIGTRTVDAKLPGSDARIKFTFNHYERGLSEQTVMLQYNTTKKSVKSNIKGVYSLAIKPGKYTFTITQTGCDTLIEKIEIKKQERVEITVNFGVYTPPMQEAEKPVIYLYPTQKSEIEVKVNAPKGLTLTYPEYKDGWKVTAEPDGTIESDGKTYNYLFWEGPTENLAYNENETGFYVAKENLMDFLTKNLTTLGLNSKEQQDFITWWYPKMQSYDNTYVRFLLNDECNSIATLDISPKPDAQLRVYMVWMDAKNVDPAIVVPQELPSFARKGFAAIEWGGVQMTPSTE